MATRSRTSWKSERPSDTQPENHTLSSANTLHVNTTETQRERDRQKERDARNWANYPGSLLFLSRFSQLNNWALKWLKEESGLWGSSACKVTRGVDASRVTKSRSDDFLIYTGTAGNNCVCFRMEEMSTFQGVHLDIWYCQHLICLIDRPYDHQMFHCWDFRKRLLSPEMLPTVRRGHLHDLLTFDLQALRGADGWRVI